MKRKNLLWLALVSLGIILDIGLMCKSGFTVVAGINLVILSACAYALSAKND